MRLWLHFMWCLWCAHKLRKVLPPSIIPPPSPSLVPGRVWHAVHGSELEILLSPSPPPPWYPAGYGMQYVEVSCNPHFPPPLPLPLASHHAWLDLMWRLGCANELRPAQPLPPPPMMPRLHQAASHVASGQGK